MSLSYQSTFLLPPARLLCLIVLHYGGKMHSREKGVISDTTSEQRIYRKVSLDKKLIHHNWEYLILEDWMNH